MFAIPDNTVLGPLHPHPLSPTATVRWVSATQRWRDQLSGSAGAPVALPRRIPHDDPRVDIWLSVWQPGGWPVADLPERAYDASQGAFAVLSGVVVEHTHSGARTLRPGQVRVFGPGYRHRVRNVGPEPAVAVHVQIGQPG